MPTLTPTLEVEEREPQIGGGPPEAGGDGRDDRDGGDDGNSGPEGSGPPSSRERLRRYRMGLATGLVSVIMLFVALTSAYVVRQGVGVWDEASGTYKTDWRPLHVPPILWINTALLMLSSVTVERARRSLLAPAVAGWPGMLERRKPIPWLGITLVLGTGFLAGQYIAWGELRRQGIYLATNPSSSFFYVLTGAHAVHLLGGLLALLYAAAAPILAPSRSLASRQITLDVAAWYWHFMGFLWIYIFALLHFAK